ncbi:CinA family protein [Nocardioides sp.]|uniref:CinA family protein n=1 Tax=Nocardioides sp. TaxID=35761 RepID=UPI002ED4EB23
MTSAADDHAQRIAELAQERGQSVATAESLTSGRVAASLGAAPHAASWFRGGVVSYHDEVKHGVLGVDPGPVVCEPAARQMAAGVARLLGAEIAVATTGAGGPDPQDGQPPGTVFIVVRGAGEVVCREMDLDGDPAEVVEASTVAALALLREAMESDS